MTSAYRSQLLRIIENIVRPDPDEIGISPTNLMDVSVSHLTGVRARPHQRASG